MPQRVLGIDIGHWSVKAVLVESSYKNFDVLEATEVACDEVSVATTDLQGTLSSGQRRALRSLLNDPDLKADVYVVNYPGEKAVVRFLELPFKDARRIGQVIGGDLADVIPFDIDESVYDHSVIQSTDDGSLCLAVAARSEDVSDWLSGIKEAGIDPRFLPCDMLQLQNLYSHFLADDGTRPATASEEEEQTVISSIPGSGPEARLLVDIGHSRTTLSLCSEEGVLHTRVLRYGSEQVTEAIAKAYRLDVAQAERGKQGSALVATARHPAPDDQSQRMSDVVKEGLKPLVRELRTTLSVIRKEKRAVLSRIDLLGGGAHIRHLSSYLAEALNVPVHNAAAVEQMLESTQAPAARRGAYGLALALALRGSGQDSKHSTVGFRKGEFQFTGGFQQLQDRLPFLLASAAVILVFLLAYVISTYVLINRRESDIDGQFCKITKKVVGQEICEPARALAAIENPSTELGDFQLPDRTAFQIMSDISSMIPPETKTIIAKMSVSEEKARMEGTTQSFDAVDKIVTALGKDPCFKNIKKDKLDKTPDGKRIRFPLTIELRCEE